MPTRMAGAPQEKGTEQLRVTRWLGGATKLGMALDKQHKRRTYLVDEAGSGRSTDSKYCGHRNSHHPAMAAGRRDRSIRRRGPGVWLHGSAADERRRRRRDGEAEGERVPGRGRGYFSARLLLELDCCLPRVGKRSRAGVGTLAYRRPHIHRTFLSNECGLAVVDWQDGARSEFPPGNGPHKKMYTDFFITVLVYSTTNG
jgi:hypothetical protein